MDILYGSGIENQCKSIFTSDQSMIRERFTKLWTQIISEKENDVERRNSGQTDLFKL